MSAPQHSPLNLDLLEKAVNSLRGVLSQPKTTCTQSLANQLFEYTFQLAWKALRRHLATEHAVYPVGVRDVFPQAGRHGIIADVEAWLTYLKAHNVAPFADDESTYRIAVAFLPDAQALLDELKRRCGTCSP